MKKNGMKANDTYMFYDKTRQKGKSGVAQV